MVRLDAVLVGVEALQREAEHLRRADHAVVGEVLAQYDVARAHERREREEDRVRRAVRDQQRVDGSLRAEAGEPFDPGRAVVLEAGDRPHARIHGWSGSTASSAQVSRQMRSCSGV